METAAVIKNYNLAPPTEKDVFASLDRLVGQEESRRLWTAACRQAGVRSNGALPLEQIESALQQLKQEKGLAMVAANSLLVRVKSYRTLSLLNSK
ncbi:hypothetical protein [Caldimonas tepidiphila]|uniref:hypothetical protein n=1 Tax=Caldimonas tepidiphila TaxID=2315841 RepID=UPI00130023AE|nr:hypothetical protein [Caldimonas tepidiphila]